mgnify:CR=1 FL=1
MTTPNVTIITWNRKRRNAAGKIIRSKRYAASYICPETGNKRRISFPTKAKAEEYRQVLLAQFAGERYFNPNTNPTVAEAVDHWLENKRGTVKPQTIRGYLPLLKNITGPILQGSPQEKVHYALTGEKPHRDAKVLQMLGNFKVSELTTAQLRRWHNLVRVEAGHHTANRVMSMLKGILALAEEDFGVRVCSMPTNLARRKSKPKKEIMTPEEIAKFIGHAKLNPDRSMYVIFPLMTGARISEALGLLWDDIDFEHDIISIRRVQERDGTTTNTTKTEAGEREIPISPTLRTMLLEWRLRCPRLEGKLHRVFPGPGVQRQWPLPRIGGGGPILYSNFLKRYWKPAFVGSGVKYRSLHLCRHSFISILQSQGVDLAVVSEIVGHSNPAVTLGHYTQAVRGGAEALAMLDKAYQGE